MQIILDVQSPSELWSLLEYLRSLQTVKIILSPKNGTSKISPQDPQVAVPNMETIQLIAQKEEGDIIPVPPDRKPHWDFNRFYGAAKTGMSIEQIDAKLNELRSEWERDTY